jgi:ribulose-phosphate 3-epimerase
MAKCLISASILSADFRFLFDQIHQAMDAGVDGFHLDVMDGHFVPNLTIGPVIAKACRKATEYPIDAHLMVTNPDLLLKAYQEAGVNRLIIHVEENPDVVGTLHRILDLGMKPGIVINPETPTLEIKPLLDLVDLILIMSVHPGFAGQDFLQGSLPRIRKTKQMILDSKREIILEVDGGITPTNIKNVVQSGADAIASASAIFQHPQGIAKGVQSLRDALK